MVAALMQQVADLVRVNHEQNEVTKILVSRLGDPEWLTVKEAAQLEQRLYGKGSEASVRSKIEAGVYDLVKRQGEKSGRIFIRQILDAHRKEFQPIGTYRSAKAQEKKERR
jgi:hypothetical protein